MKRLIWAMVLAAWAGTSAVSCQADAEESYISPDGNYQFRFAKPPTITDPPPPLGASPMRMATVQEQDGTTTQVGHGKVDFSEVRRQGTDRILDGRGRFLIEKFAKYDAKSTTKVIRLGPHPGREVRFEVGPPKSPLPGIGVAQVYLVGDRIYTLFSTSPKRPGAEEAIRARLGSFTLIKAVEPAPAQGIAAIPRPDPRTRPRPTQPEASRPNKELTLEVGGREGPDPNSSPAGPLDAVVTPGRLTELPERHEVFRDIAVAGGILVGFRVTYAQAFGKANIGSVRPIYQAGAAYVAGGSHGHPDGPEATVMARPGYAVGGLNTRPGANLDAFQVVFMKVRDGRLDPADSYPSAWLGDPRGGSLKAVSGDGKIAVGVHGRSNDRMLRDLGLIVTD